jgi:hypothetical protein
VPLQILNLRRADTFLSRIQRGRDDGYAREFLEGRLFKLAVAEGFKREQLFDWLDNAIDEGREERDLQHASEREAEAWDMSCRIAFFVEIASRR